MSYISQGRVLVPPPPQALTLYQNLSSDKHSTINPQKVEPADLEQHFGVFSQFSMLVLEKLVKFYDSVF